MTTEHSGVDRRTVLQGLGSIATAGAIAGCSTSDAGGGTDGGSANNKVDNYLSDTSNYDSIVDETGNDEVTVKVGVQANSGYFGFGPPAIRIDSGTTVVWEWTGQGSSHNVVHKDGEFESELKMDEGATFEHTFDSSGTYLYYCNPHKTMGMKGAVVVE